MSRQVKLSVKRVSFNIPIYNDSVPSADPARVATLFTWKPPLEAGWYYLGPAATKSNQGSDGVIVKLADAPPGVDAFVSITTWKQVWSGTISGQKFALWKGLPEFKYQNDYTVVGGFFTRSDTKPSDDDTKGMMAVHKDCLVKVDAGKQMWKNQAADPTGSVWEISAEGHLQGVETGAFAPADEQAPRATYALDRKTSKYVT